ncbi:MAG: hypothetical protein PVH73_05645 [Candidatus Bathyarchaeota archaeon]
MRGWVTKAFSLIIIVLICVMTGNAPLPFPSVARVSAAPNVPYTLGNWTKVNKPVLPIRINASQIPIGSDWTYVYPLEMGSAYRVYCYGDWIDPSPTLNKTDYDIFVYDPSGNLESYHTEAAGLPEHLGTTVDHPFFIPKQTGDYSFQVKNDARESNGTEAATFMVIEHVDSGRWYQRYMKGKVNDEPVERTTWAYEFNSTSSRVEVWVEVPDTLDMYEARLYIMTNPSAEENATLNGVPLAWEPALYGNTSENYGGYNLDSDGLRYTEAIASCEYPGEDMLINFTVPVEGNLLYHLAFIAEHGEGVIDFMVKTDFDAPELSIIDPVEKAEPNDKISITAQVEEQNNLETVTLNYTSNNWATSTAAEMVASQNQTYTGKIPRQPAGTVINYTVLACDTSGNSAEFLGSYEVKNSVNITLGLSSPVVYYGENITVTGSTPVSETNVALTYAMLNTSMLNFTVLDSAAVTDAILNYTSSNNTAVSRLVSTDSSGNFRDVYSLNQTGTWIVWASWNGSETYFDASSDYWKLTVKKIPMAITCNITSSSPTIGENVTVTGQVYPVVENLTVTLTFIGSNSSIEQVAYTDSNGTYLVSWKPDSMGLWQMNAHIAEDAYRSAAYSNSTSFKVNDTWLNQYLLYIIGGVGGAAGVTVVFIIRRRRYE